MKIHLGADHAGFELKEQVKEFLKTRGFDVTDEGAFEYNKDDDYPDFVRLVALQVGSDKDSRGIIFGGSGQGEAMVANRTKGVRAVVYYGPIKPHSAVDMEGRVGRDDLEIVRLSREHNNSNILSIGARFVTKEEAIEAINLWLTTEFSGSDRHIRRIMKIDNLIQEENEF